ncbi:MAG: ABC transporter ATP-binding protein, partial [Clostridia bacterium]
MSEQRKPEMQGKVQMGGGPGRGPAGGKPKLETSLPSIMKKLFSIVLKEYIVQLIIVLACILTSAIVSVQGTLFIETLIDGYIMPLIGVENADFTPLAQALMLLGMIYAVGVIASFAYTRIMVFVSQGTLNKIRKQTFSHMETLPIKYFDNNAYGDIMSVYTNDIDTLRQLISQTFPQLFNSSITFVATVASMIVLNVPLTIVMFVMITIMLYAAKTIGGKSGKFFKEQQQSLGKLNGYVEEMIRGQKVVKVFSYEERAKKQFDELNDNLQQASEKANKFANILMPVNGQLGNLSYVLVAVLGGILSITGVGGVTIGTLIAFLQLSKSVVGPISQVSMQINFVVMGAAGAERIFKLLDQKPEEDDGYVSLVNVTENEKGEIKESEKVTGMWAWKHFHKADGTVTYIRQRGNVEFENVDFGYTDAKLTLKNINLEAKEGQKIAFVGSTGAGKTTITNLINRFYDIQSGKIRYDGINIKKIKKADLRKSLGMVLQDTHLFTGSVLDNIRYGKLDATEEECIKAAKIAGAHSFISRLPEAYNTQITGDGASLSGGQRQLLAIARTTVANPPALILDEATSSIDTGTEKLVQEGMDSLMKGRTTFVI